MGISVGPLPDVDGLETPKTKDLVLPHEVTPPTVTRTYRNGPTTKTLAETSKDQASPRQLFMEALARHSKTKQMDLFSHFVAEAYRNPTVLIAAMNKLLPNKAQIVIAPEDMHALVSQVAVIVTKYVKDPDVLRNLLTELESIRLPSEELVPLNVPKRGRPRAT